MSIWNDRNGTEEEREWKATHTVRAHYGLFQTENCQTLGAAIGCGSALKCERFHCSHLLLMILNSSSNKFDRGSWQSINWIVFFFHPTIFCLFRLVWILWRTGINSAHSRSHQVKITHNYSFVYIIRCGAWDDVRKYILCFVFHSTQTHIGHTCVERAHAAHSFHRCHRLRSILPI